MDDEQSRWLAGALRSRALWYGPQGPEPNRQKSDQVEPLPFIDGFSRAPVQPQAADDLLLQGGLDGVQRPERRSHQPSTKLYDTVAAHFRRQSDYVESLGCISGFREKLTKSAYSARLEEHMSDQREQQRPLTTTDAGSPAPSNDTSLTVGPNGPVLLQDAYLVKKLGHFVRERIPDRVYHVKGSGAFGYFEVTEDVTQWTKAAFLNKVGKRTPMFVRFSTVAGEDGYADTDRDVRGFALKFYTEEGNYDLVGNDTPVFFVRDPMKFPDFIHSQERMPDTGLRSNNMQWDFWTLSPESAHQVTWLMGDRGTPRTYRHMNGYSSSAYLWENAAGQKVWVKYHFKTEQGIQNFTDAEAKAMRGEDPDYHRRDLNAAIARKDYPSWRLEMQIMPFEDAANYRFNPFDLTKAWPHKDYPTIPIGRMVLDRNPENFLRSGRAGRVRRGELCPGDRAQPGPDGAGAAVRLRRLEPL